MPLPSVTVCPFAVPLIVTVMPLRPLPTTSKTRPLILNTLSGLQFEKAEVLFAGSVAVAVTTLPSATLVANEALMFAFPVPSVVVVAEPRKICPSPVPDGSQLSLMKNCMVNV